MHQWQWNFINKSDTYLVMSIVVNWNMQVLQMSDSTAVGPKISNEDPITSFANSSVSTQLRVSFPLESQSDSRVNFSICNLQQVWITEIRNSKNYCLATRSWGLARRPSRANTQSYMLCIVQHIACSDYNKFINVNIHGEMFLSIIPTNKQELNSLKENTRFHGRIVSNFNNLIKPHVKGTFPCI